MAATSRPRCDSRKLSCTFSHCGGADTLLDSVQLKEDSMSVALAERDTAPLTIEPVVNYIVNDGTKLITYVGFPGVQETKNSGTPDPRRIVMHNGRPHLNEFKLDVDGFRFVHHDTKVQNFFDETELRRVYYPE